MKVRCLRVGFAVQLTNNSWAGAARGRIPDADAHRLESPRNRDVHGPRIYPS